MPLCAVSWCACYAVAGHTLCAVHRVWKGDVDQSRPEQPDLSGEGVRYFRTLDTVRKQQAGAAKGASTDCPTCRGSGECPHCKGSGQVECQCTCGDCHERDCFECDGSGDCPRCL